MRRKDSNPLSELDLPTMLVLLTLVVVLLILCLFGATAGLESIRMHQSMGLMAPIWFVGSALGALILGFTMVGMLATLIVKYAQKWRALRKHSNSSPEQ